jgi:hypothetical protein
MQEIKLDGLDGLLANPNFPKFYMNGFVVGNGNSDGFVLIQTNSLPTAVINLSFTTMKTLAKSLNDIVENIEKKTNKEIATTSDLDIIMKI